MGRKEAKRYEDNERVKKILRQETHSDEDIAFMKQAYTGVGGLVSSGWDNGQFFTPSVITEFVVDLLGIEEGRVLEPSCGGGAFLRALPEACDVTGIEYMVETSEVSRICYPDATIIQGDALTQTFDEPFDYVIGNPPYGLKVDDWEFDSGKKAKSEIAFIEYGLRNLREGGFLAMVIPDGILSNRNALAFRKHIFENHTLCASISLPIQTFYHAGTSVKTSILIIRKGVHAFAEHQKVFMAMCEEIGWDTRGKPTSKSNIPEILDEYRKFKQESDLMNMEIAIRYAQEMIDNDDPAVEKILLTEEDFNIPQMEESLAKEDPPLYDDTDDGQIRLAF